METNMIPQVFLPHKSIIIFLFAKVSYNIGFYINHYLDHLSVGRCLVDETLERRMSFRDRLVRKPKFIDLVRPEIPVVISQLAKCDEVPVASHVINTDRFYLALCRFIFFN